MFQRLKGAIDSRIAEEQARQRQAALQASGRPPARRRPTNPNAAARSPARTKDAAIEDKGPDPQEFEADFAVGDVDSKASSAKETTGEGKDGAGEGDNKDAVDVDQDMSAKQALPATPEQKATDTTDSPAALQQSSELPTEVRVKLRKLERLESKYGELLKAYRMAHARVKVIEPFEAALRENTPLTSIADPGAMIEYLNQTKLKGEMVMDELKRVTADREEFKKKAEQSEKNSTKLKIELEELKEQVESKVQEAPQGVRIQENKTTDIKSPEVAAQHSGTNDSLKAETITTSRLGSFSFLSPRLGPTTKAESKPQNKQENEDLFSYDSEVPKLELELQEKTVEVQNLNEQIQQLRTDLKVTRESTEGMMQTLEERTKEVNVLRETNISLESEKSSLEQRLVELTASAEMAEGEVRGLQEKLDDLEQQHKNSNSQAGEELRKAQEKWNQTEADLKSQVASLEACTTTTAEELSATKRVVEDLESSLTAAKTNEEAKGQRDNNAEKKIKVMNGIMDDIRSQLDSAKDTVKSLRQELQAKQEEFANRPSSKVFGFLDESSATETAELTTKEDAITYLQHKFDLQKSPTPQRNGQTVSSSAIQQGNLDPIAPNAASKKKNKKKKKVGKESQTVEDAGLTPATLADSSEGRPESVNQAKDSAEDDTKSSAVVASLETKLAEQLAVVGRLTGQIKDQEALKEEIETLRDDLLHQGEEHVEARDALKQSREERNKLQENMDSLERDLSDARKQTSNSEEAQKAHVALKTQFAELEVKFGAMEKDLKAAEQLAAARFKDISDLKELLTKAQPELRSLRAEVAEMKTAKESLKNKQGELTRLEAKHEDLKSEMKGLSKRLGDKDVEIKELQHKVDQEGRARSKVEDELTSTQSDLRIAESRKKEVNERLEQASRDLARAKTEAHDLRNKVRDAEDQLSNHRREISSLKDEVSLQTTLHKSSQALAQSLRDQTQELTTQARETTSRTDSLEDELNEAQRMLTERTRESTTMRMLLNQAESGTESRIREMKERMDAAIEERDRVEDEANVSSRRMMRDVEDAKTKARDAQRQLKALEDERDELESKARDWRRRREELEQLAETAKVEVDEVRSAMKGLRDALDESERQVRDAEQHRLDLRKQSEEALERIEKLTKANKNLTEEIRSLQQGGMNGPMSKRGSLRPAGTDSGLQSSRTSMDSVRSPSLAPLQHQRAAVSRTNTSATESTTTSSTGLTQSHSKEQQVGLSQATVDVVYLKNVLLQFLERKDRGPQIIPVLGMLLHFSREDEQRFTRAVSVR